MSEVILKIENLSKQYRLGLVGTGTLSHDLNRWWHAIRGKEDPYLQVGASNDRSKQADGHYVWALQDINLEVKRGEVLGIIGKNGAGKSTLLKILSRVTLPSTGVVKSWGRIASLLEVGTGFHPELTGRENIYLNGAILGMTKAEIKAKEEEIVEFSGCAMYIDTPVKRYSSGMRVRLGFAVAAFLEPDILVVDEVLAVGDAEFQKKAIGKMQDISNSEGRTVLFVSHNMTAVKSLCSRGIVLSNGEEIFEGNSNDAVDYYLSNSNQVKSNYIQNDNNLHSPIVEIQSVGVRAKGKGFEDIIYQDDALEFEVRFTKKTEEPLGLNFRIKDAEQNILFTDGSLYKLYNKDRSGEFTYRMTVPGNLFNKGEFFADFGCVFNKQFYFLKECYLNFQVFEKAKGGSAYFGKT